MGIVSGEECMKAGDVKYAIFDDMRGGIKFFHAWKEWLGCQETVTVKCLYREPKQIKWLKPTIWVANTDPRLDMDPQDVAFLEKNCKFVEVVRAIFHANTE